MIATFTADALTPLTFERAASAMKAALASQMTAAVREDQLALALAKTALETGRWQKFHAWNWGNVKAGDDFVGMFTAFGCGEELSEGSCWFDPDGTITNRTKKTIRKPVAYDVPPGHPQTRFRAYANEFDGAFEYVDFVNSGHYAGAWKALLTGDALAYVHQLKLAHYFTADETVYAVGVVALQKEFASKLRGIAAEPTRIDWTAIQNCSRVALARHRDDFLGHSAAEIAAYETINSPSVA